jgi:HEAT repeat protein
MARNRRKSKGQSDPGVPQGYTAEEWAEYQRDPCGWCVKELRNPDRGVRCNAADILRGLAFDAVAAIPALAEGLCDPDEQVRAYCAHALVDIGEAVNRRVPSALPSLAATVPALTAVLSDESGEVRALAAHALGAVGPPAAAAVPRLRQLLSDSEEEVRAYAARALASIVGSVDG